MSAPIDTQAIVAEALFNDIGRMVDAYGAIDAQIKALEAQKEKLRKGLIATGRGCFTEGATFALTIDLSERRSVKLEDVIKTFGAEAAKAITNTSDVYTLRPKRKA